MISEIKLLGTEWKYNNDDLNNYMKQLAIQDSNITGITLDLSESGFTTQTSYYRIKIPNNIMEFTLIGKNTANSINYIYASLVAEGGGETYFNCKVINLGLSANNPDNDTNGVFIDIAGNIAQNEVVEEGNTLQFSGNNSIVASKTGNYPEAKLNAAIHIGEGQRLSIYFEDDNTKLECIGFISNYASAAGIGGNSNESAGNIIMYTAGTINIRGGYRGAGIGGGSNGSGGKIKINGIGTVMVTGGINAAGIGGGFYGASGSITINTFANMQVTGGNGAAGIGSGYNGAVESIDIDAMNILDVQGGDGGAGIGSGSEGAPGFIKINVGWQLITTGGINASGIGGGFNVSGGYIGIKGSGELIANGGINGAGIGGGINGSVGTIEITGELDIGAKGGLNTSAIGAGDNGAPGEIKIIGSGEISCNRGEMSVDDIGSGNPQIISKDRVIIYPVVILTPGIAKPSVRKVQFKKEDGAVYIGKFIVKLNGVDEYRQFISSTDKLGYSWIYADNAIADISTPDGKFIVRNLDLTNPGDNIILYSNIKFRGINIFGKI
ncbi:hypothetical protein [Clostridium sp. D53t1_180928_C8]|uniref:hypothetical protein n=1 Tax=Clostridium sp. D53t1_180928_C8 TaxID=2787101 RepID=UPI0018AB0A3C|nr:hypothetical protein [Clostridium sp. D53t1_180928_C8]